ncbi:MAG TPA: SCO family protein, partial [Stenotrophomonas sp.]
MGSWVVVCVATMVMATTAWAGDTIGGPFSLVDQQGHAVTDKTYQGKPVLLYFGFTSCPDVCPTDL